MEYHIINILLLILLLLECQSRLSIRIKDRWEEDIVCISRVTILWPSIKHKLG